MADGIFGYHMVRRHQQRIFGRRPGDRQPIKRVAVDERRIQNANRMGAGDGEFLVAFGDQHRPQPLWVDIEVRLPQRLLDRHLKDRDRAEPDIVAGVLPEFSRISVVSLDNRADCIDIQIKMLVSTRQFIAPLEKRNALVPTHGVEIVGNAHLAIEKA